MGADARRGDRDRARDRSPPPARDARSCRSFGDGRPVDRRAHQRMTETHPRAELDQARGLGRRRRVGPDAEPLGRPPQQRRSPTGSAAATRAAARVSAGSGSNLAAGSSPRSGSPAAARRAARIRPPAPPASTRAATPAAPADCRASRRRSGRAPARPAARDRRGEQRARITVTSDPRPPAPASPANSSFVARPHAPRTPDPTDSASRRRATNASACAETRSSHCASSTRQTSGCFLGHLRQQAEHRQPDEEAIRRLARPQAERRAKRIALRTRQLLQPVQHRRAQLLQRRRTRAPSRTRPRRVARRGILPRAPTGIPASAVFPNPASPRSTSTALCPACMASRSRSSSTAFGTPAAQHRSTRSEQAKNHWRPG